MRNVDNDTNLDFEQDVPPPASIRYGTSERKVIHLPKGESK
jgi:hypothetical protein